MPGRPFPTCVDSTTSAAAAVETFEICAARVLRGVRQQWRPFYDIGGRRKPIVNHCVGFCKRIVSISFQPAFNQHTRAGCDALNSKLAQIKGLFQSAHPRRV